MVGGGTAWPRRPIGGKWSARVGRRRNTRTTISGRRSDLGGEVWYVAILLIRANAGSDDDIKTTEAAFRHINKHMLGMERKQPKNLVQGRKNFNFRVPSSSGNIIETHRPQKLKGIQICKNATSETLVCQRFIEYGAGWVKGEDSYWNESLAVLDVAWRRLEGREEVNTLNSSRFCGRISIPSGTPWIVRVTVICKGGIVEQYSLPNTVVSLLFIWKSPLKFLFEVNVTLNMMWL
jgi:hypothetical protein